jgi:hypothetical protein
MKSLITSINNLVLAINNLTASLNKKDSGNSTPASYPSATTSNPYSSNVKITSYYETKSSSVTISRQEYEALKNIYSALTDKGSYPKHHDHVARELKLKWPVLNKALEQFVKAYQVKHNPSTKYKPSAKNIWKD